MAHRIFLLIVIIFFPLVGGAIDASNQGRLRDLLRHDCGSCHGMTLKGGLGANLTHERMKGRSFEALQAIILNGIPGTAMPPWRGILTEDEAAFLARVLKEGKYE